MPVYVDNAKNAFGRMKTCHMIADTANELHNMAAKIGMMRSWFQDRRVPHYDICMKRKALAIKAGAIEINRRQTVELMRKHDWLKKNRMNEGNGFRKSGKEI